MVADIIYHFKDIENQKMDKSDFAIILFMFQNWIQKKSAKWGRISQIESFFNILHLWRKQFRISKRTTKIK